MKAILVAMIFLTNSFIASNASGQTANSGWLLNSSSQMSGFKAGTYSSYLTVSSEILSPGSNPAVEIVDYTPHGQRLRPVTGSFWTAGVEDPSRYLQFEVSVTASITFTELSFNYGATAAGLPGGDNEIASNAYYSIDDGATWILLNQAPLSYPGQTMASFSATNLNKVVPAGGKFLLRIHPYAVQTSNPMAPIRFAVHDAVIIQGIPTYSNLQLVEGLKFNDLDGNGIRDGGEPALSGVTIQLWQNGAVVGTSVTSSNGFYSIWAPAGTYEIREVVPTGYVQTAPSGGFHSLTIGAAGIPSGLNFGNKLASVVGSICGIKFNDQDGSGDKQNSEPGLGGWTVNLSYAGVAGPITVTKVTDANGAYCFDDLTAGTYTVSEINQEGWTQTYPAAPGTWSITLASGESRDAVDFGNQAVITISGKKFLDLNNSNWYDGPAEDWIPPLPPVTIVATVLGTSTPAWTTTTDASGLYSMTIPSGPSYVISEISPNGYVQVWPNPGNGTTTYEVSNSSDLWFGNKVAPLLGQICGFKFNDINGNGQQDEGELNLEGWEINLSNGLLGEPPIASAITDERGTFCFNNLPAGNYTLYETDQDGWERSWPSIDGDGRYYITLLEGQNATDFRFGNKVSPPDLIIGGRKINDINENGVNDGAAEEWNAPLPIVTIVATLQGTTSTWSTTTNASGHFTMTVPAGGTYIISENPVAGYFQTYPSIGLSGASTHLISSSNPNLLFGNKAIPQQGSICGIKFNDINENGQQDTGELGLLGWEINLTYGGAVNTVLETVLTDSKGVFCFTGLEAGVQYTLYETNQIGWTQTKPAFSGVHTIVLAPGENRAGVEFGNHEITSGIIEGAKYFDRDGDGEWDTGELGLAGVTIILYQNGVPVDSTTTDQNGLYSFIAEAGTYTLNETVPFGYQQTEPAIGATHTITVVANETVSNINFGNKISTIGTIEGSKYVDLDGDGERDSNEIGLAGVTIVLSENGVEIGTTVTDILGNYSFTVESGTYELEERIPLGYTQTEPDNGIHTVSVAPGGTTSGFNFGNQLTTNDASICGYKFNDLNGNGEQDPGELGMLGWTLQLDYISPSGPVTITTITGDKGDYCFRGLPPGAYTLSEPPVLGWTQTVPTAPNTYSVQLTAGQSVRGFRFGNTLKQTTGVICGIKYNDLNGNGVQDREEPGIPEWPVILGGTTIDGIKTDINGMYCFDNLKPGEYTVSEEQKDGWKQTEPPSPGTYSFVLRPGDRIEKIDFGNQVDLPDGSLCGIKFNDLNQNGKQDEGELGIPGWPIYLDWNTVATTVTDREGRYCFTNLGQGDYEITEEQPKGWQQVLPGGLGSYQLNLGLGQHREGLNFGNFISPATGQICGIKFNDLNGNGQRDAGEPGIADWQINIGGAVETSILTDQKGAYCFPNLPSGAYRIAEEQRSGWRQTTPANQGSYELNFVASQSLANINFGNTQNECSTGNKQWFPLKSGLNGYVNALEVLGGSLYAGGSFSIAGGNSANNIARWNGSNWTALSSGTNGRVNAIEVIGADLYVGGQFTSAGGVSAASIAKWSPTSGWTALGTGVSGTVNALQAIGSNLYVAGNFKTAGGITANSIAKWDGSTWSMLANGTPGYFYALTEMNGNLVAGGVFFSIGGISAKFIAKWDGINWSDIGGGTSSTVTSLVSNGSDLYAGGDFPTAGGQSVHRIAKWNGTTWSDVGNGLHAGYVRALYFKGTDLYAGGDFNVSGTTTVNHIAKWDGTTWNSLSTGLNQVFSSSIIEYGGAIISGGWFSTAGGVSANNIAAYRCNDPLTEVGTLTGVVFHDFNNDGIKNPKEPASIFDRWGVTLVNGGVETTTTVGPNGFTFTGVQSGPVSVHLNLMSGWSNSGTSTGSQTFDFQSEVGQTGVDFGVLKNPIQECVVPPANMQAWWTFDEGASSVGAVSADRAGHNNVGVQVNGPSSVLGRVDGALHFDQTNDYVKVNDKIGLDFGMGDFSFDAWIRTGDHDGALIGDLTSGAGWPPALSGWLIYLEGGRLKIRIGQDHQYSMSGVLVPTGEWHHIAVTISRAIQPEVIFYVDGVAYPELYPLPIAYEMHSSGPLKMGASISGFPRFVGDLDEIELFDRALSALEINSIYQAGGAGKCKYDPNTGSVGGSVFHDLNNDGIKGPLEEGLSNISVVLTGKETVNTTTDVDGNFNFSGVMAGPNELSFDLPLGWSVEGGTGMGYGFELKPFSNISPLNVSFTPEGCRESTKVWSPLGLGMNGQVTALATQGNSLYAGGWFTTADGNSANHIARWDGSAWHPLGRGVNGNVYALLVVGTDLYVGGEFTSADGVNALNIAKWNGTSWSAVGSGTNQPVRALEMVGNTIYAGGDFTVAGGLPANFIAKWDGVNWSPVGTGMNSSVFALTRSGTDLYAGGMFTTAGGVSASHVAKWNGSSWTALGSGVQPTSGAVVWSLKMVNSNLYVGGILTSAGGLSTTNLAKWDTISSTWDAMGHTGSRVYALDNLGADVYAGGWIGSISFAGTSLNVGEIAKWDENSWSVLGNSLVNGVSTSNGNAGNADVLAIEVQGSTVYAGGAFRSAAGTNGLISANYVARYSCPAPKNTSVEDPIDQEEIPTQVLLAQNYPNPFNPITRIRYQLPTSVSVRMEIFDVLGRRVSVLVNEIQSAGTHEIEFDASLVPSGIYFYRLTAGNISQAKKMILLK